ncbi:hypothetical protein AHIS1636_13240 [Arthrobacter mangrovi]|uniref:Uncharacterized protein n=2 Tax=Arthrobacter mangrovi TaxID=2966350 RepID=A0ABQ5MSD5_9MICC|nr:hypothetical protein AHIS1636_13240 [Arthrobacter mangrovi]
MSNQSFFLRIAAVLSITMSQAAIRLRTTFTDDDPERGDVPGWVMITLMSAVLVAGILAIAKPALEGLFNDAMGRVSQP